MSVNLTTQKRLELFAQRVKELIELRLVQGGMGAKLSMSWDSTSQQLTQQVIQPDEEDLRSFLLLFRHFISKREPVFIPGIFDDCHRFLKSSELTDELKKMHEDWKQIFTFGAFQLMIDNQNVTGEQILDLWINGFYFHNDSHKADELNRYFSASYMPTVRMEFLSALTALTQIIGYTGAVVFHGLKEGLFHIPSVAS